VDVGGIEDKNRGAELGLSGDGGSRISGDGDRICMGHAERGRVWMRKERPRACLREQKSRLTQLSTCSCDVFCILASRCMEEKERLSDVHFARVFAGGAVHVCM
jgi:hypothetical protein